MKQNIVAAFYLNFARSKLLFIVFKISVYVDSSNLSLGGFNGTQRDHSSTFGQNCCFDTYYNKKITNKYDYPKYFDIITQGDIVQQQYLTLPYPPVQQNDILNEQMYYSGNKPTKPFDLSSYTFTLENVNHFLFRCCKEFRYD